MERGFEVVGGACVSARVLTARTNLLYYMHNSYRVNTMSIDQMSTPEQQGNYRLEANQQFLNFQSVKETKIDEEKAWKPALEVQVTNADGTIVEGLGANTPFFTFEDVYGNKLTVSAAAAGHIDEIHIKGKDAGSKFDEPSLEALLKDAATKMPEGIATEKGVSAFDIEMGKSMGRDGIASMAELKDQGVLTTRLSHQNLINKT